MADVGGLIRCAAGETIARWVAGGLLASAAGLSHEEDRGVQRIVPSATVALALLCVVLVAVNLRDTPVWLDASLIGAALVLLLIAVTWLVGKAVPASPPWLRVVASVLLILVFGVVLIVIGASRSFGDWPG